MQDCKTVAKSCVFEANVLSGLGSTKGIERLFNQRPVTTHDLIAGRMRNRPDGRQHIMKHLLMPVRKKLLKILRIPKIRKPQMRNRPDTEAAHMSFRCHGGGPVATSTGRS